MLQQSRRKFISFLGKAAAVSGLATMAACETAANSQVNGFVHHVYFWLNNPDSAEDKARLIEGLRTLTKIGTIKQYQIGVPAGTNREVIDSTYAISWLLVFDDKAAQDSYQEDPIHLKFVEDYSSLWSRVVVYDSVEV